MKSTLSGIIFVTSVSLSGLSYTGDFSQYSNDDLFGMRDQMRTMDDASKDAYRTERQGRMSSMNQTERDSRFSNMGASGKRNMEQRSGRGYGQGGNGGGQGGNGGGQGNGGGKHRYAQANDSDNGSSNRYRYGQSQDSDSSSQYGYGSSSSGSQYGGSGGRRYGGNR